MQVIIYTNPNGGNVCVCTPTGLLSVAATQAKDVPSGVASYIVDDSTLPEADNDFFDAWRLTVTNGVPSVAVDIPTAITQTLSRINMLASNAAAIRRTNALLGVPNSPEADADFTALIVVARAAASAATTTADLRAAIAQVPQS